MGNPKAMTIDGGIPWAPSALPAVPPSSTHAATPTRPASPAPVAAPPRDRYQAPATTRPATLQLGNRVVHLRSTESGLDKHLERGDTLDHQADG